MTGGTYYATEHEHEHEHEPDIPPALDNEGRCLVCGLLVQIHSLERVAEAAGPLARLPFPVSGDERNDWRVHQQRLRNALAALNDKQQT